MYDRYRDRRRHGALPPNLSIEEQVLVDLAATEDETEKLEILDSYAAYNKRVYREAMVSHSLTGLVMAGGQLISQLLEPVIDRKFPEVICPLRGRPVKPDKE